MQNAYITPLPLKGYIVALIVAVQELTLITNTNGPSVKTTVTNSANSSTNYAGASPNPVLNAFTSNAKVKKNKRIFNMFQT